MPNDEAELLDRISLPELADELRCHKQSLFKVATRLGINTIKRRDPDRRNQLVATVSSEEALAIKKEVLTWTKTGGFGPDGEELIADDGVFYLIQLEPEHDPGRIKLGFTTDLTERLRKHKCSAPFAMAVKTWPCRRIWERTVMDCVAAGLEQLHTEVFRTPSLDDVAGKADSFFSLMPVVKPEADADC